MKIDRYKLSLAAILSAFSVAYYNYDHEYVPYYKIYDEPGKAYGEYSNGYVYIGDTEYLTSLENINGGDILILDNPKAMTIFSSYRVTNKDERDEILTILKDYEIRNKTLNHRSLESMRMEWFVHNLLYYCNYKTERTRDVDFENNEEKTYNNKMLSKILKI